MSKNKKNPLRTPLGLLAKTSLMALVAVVLSKILTYVYRIAIARTYGPEAYGLFALSLTVVGWFIIVSRLGLTQGLTRYISLFRGRKKKKEISYIFTTISRVLLVTGLIAAAALFILSEPIAINIFNSPDLSAFLKIFSIVIPITLLSGSFLSATVAYERPGWHLLFSRVLDNVSKATFIVLLIFLGVDAISIPLSYVIGSFITLIAVYIFCKKYLKDLFVGKKSDFKSVEKKRLSKEIFSYSWPLIFFGFAMSVLHWTDTLLLGLFRSIGEVGFYNAAIPIALLLTISIELFRPLFFPLVTRKYSAGDKETVKQLSQQVGKWVFMVSFPLFIMFLFFPGVFINVLFGKEFLVAENALRFLAVGAMFTAIFEVSKELLSMKGKSKLILIDTVAVAAINLILNVILIPPFGINGAAAATMISLMALGIIFAIQSKRELNILPLRRKMISISLVALLASSVLFLGKNSVENNPASLIIIGIAFVLIYILGIFIFGGLDRNDRLVLDLFRNKFSIKKKEISQRKDL